MTRFSWGQVIDRHEIGPYEIIEFHPWHYEGGRSDGRTVDGTKRHFHGHIDGKDAHESWGSLDEALAGLIVRRRLGPNHHAIAAHFIAGIAKMEAAE